MGHRMKFMRHFPMQSNIVTIKSLSKTYVDLLQIHIKEFNYTVKEVQKRSWEILGR